MDFTTLLDALGAGIVLGGTLLATLVGSGRRELAAALAGLWHLLHRPFDYERARAEIARDVETLKVDGVLRARGFNTSDAEISTVTKALIHDRSMTSLIDAHERFRRQRTHARKLALRPIRLAAEMAPVFGMAGTLFSLSQLDYGTEGGGTAIAAIGLAIVTTLYGLLLAHLALHPLASLIERRGLAEEEERQQLIDWMARQLAGAVPPSRPPAPTPPRLERVV
jgi:chemotaxis protein MotA